MANPASALSTYVQPSSWEIVRQAAAKNNELELYAKARTESYEVDNRVRADQARANIEEALNRVINYLRPEDRLTRLALEMLNPNPQRRPTAEEALNVIRHLTHNHTVEE